HSTLGCALVRTCPVSVCDRRGRSENSHDRQPAATCSIHLLTICSVLLSSSVAYGTSGCNAGARRRACIDLPRRGGWRHRPSAPGRQPASTLRTGAPTSVDSSHWGRLAAPAL